MYILATGGLFYIDMCIQLPYHGSNLTSRPTDRGAQTHKEINMSRLIVIAILVLAICFFVWATVLILTEVNLFAVVIEPVASTMKMYYCGVCK